MGSGSTSRKTASIRAARSSRIPPCRPSSRWRASTCSRWPATSASTCREPLGEPRRFSRRVPTSRRALESRPHEFDSCLLTSATLLELSPGYPCMLFGAAARPARRDAATTATVVAVFKILIFRNFKRFEDVNRGTVWPKKKKKKKKKKFSGLIPLLKKKKKKKS